MRRTQKKPLTQAEWQAFANRLKVTLASMRAMYDALLTTATVSEAEPMRRAIHKLQNVWSKAEDIAGRQFGYDKAMAMLHGEGWVYVA